MIGVLPKSPSGGMAQSPRQGVTAFQRIMGLGLNFGRTSLPLISSRWLARSCDKPACAAWGQSLLDTSAAPTGSAPPHGCGPLSGLVVVQIIRDVYLVRLSSKARGRRDQPARPIPSSRRTASSPIQELGTSLQCYSRVTVRHNLPAVQWSTGSCTPI